MPREFKCLAIITELLPNDAASHNLAQVFVQQNGAEPAQLAQTEQVLLAALAKNEKQEAYLRWVMAFDLYRDRLKDLP